MDESFTTVSTDLTEATITEVFSEDDDASCIDIETLITDSEYARNENPLCIYLASLPSSQSEIL